MSYQDIHCGRVLLRCRDAVGVFYSPNRLGYNKEFVSLGVPTSGFVPQLNLANNYND